MTGILFVFSIKLIIKHKTMVGKCDKMITLPVAVEQETVWLNRNQMAELFGRDIKTIGKHINNALNEEL